MTSKYFPQQTSDEHYVEIVETATGVVEKRMGPMSEHKADKVERGVLQRIDTDRFFVRSGTDAALTTEALKHAGIINAAPNAKKAKPAGSSPLRIACPVCGSPAGAYCKKFDGTAVGGSEQTIGPQAAARGREANAIGTWKVKRKGE